MENEGQRVSKDIGGFKILNELAKGFFGTVMLCQEQHGKKYYAIKSIPITIDSKYLAMEEANLTKKLRHPFILSSLQSFDFSDEIFIVMDLMLCDMETYLKQKTLKECESLFYGAELVDAVIYIHSIHIVHRDITLKNLMLSPLYDIKLGDFGMSKVCGDEQGITPGLLPDFQYGKVHDWRSFGQCLHKMLLGVFPWDSPKNGQNISEAAQTLLSNLSDNHYLEQLISEEMKKHIFFRTADWDSLTDGKVFRPIPEYSAQIMDMRDTHYEQRIDPNLYKIAILSNTNPTD